MTSNNSKLVATRLVAGSFGGFTLGILSGVFENVGYSNSFSFGLFCAVSGLLAGAVGHLLFSKPGLPAIRSIVNYAILGAVFFVSLSLITPDLISELMNVQGPLKSMMVGLIGGGAGGATIVILIGSYSGA